MADEFDDEEQMLTNRLFKAVNNNNIEEVKTCFIQAVDLKLKDIIYHPIRYNEYFHVCPLVLACLPGHEEITEELLKASVDPNHVSEWKRRSVMHIAAYEGVLSLSMIRSLISYGADVNLTNECGETIVQYLTRYMTHCQFNDTYDNMLAAVKLLLDNGACFNARDGQGCTPLCWACRSGNIDLARLIIAEGADVNVDNGCETLLAGAARLGNIDMFDLLLNAGANRHLRSDDLIGPCNGNDAALLARILYTCDVDINMAFAARPRVTILQFACEGLYINSGTVEVLLAHGADVGAVSDTGDTALHYAARYPDCSKIRQLLSYSSHLSIKNRENQTPLDKLIYCMHHRRYTTTRYQTFVLAFKMLVTAGAKVTADVEHDLDRLRIKHPETQILDFDTIATQSLEEMCRFVICGAIPVCANCQSANP